MRVDGAFGLWAALKYLGRRSIEELVDGLCDRAEQFVRELGEAGFIVSGSAGAAAHSGTADGLYA